MSYQPPFQITNEILNIVADISQLLGRWSANNQSLLSPQLRRGNRIKTIQASLAIENNTLSLEQVTAVISGKKVLGLPHEIQEVRNAFKAYESLTSWQATNSDHLLTAHQQLMYGLVDDAGQYRNEGVGIYREKQLIHMAPPANRVSLLINDLLNWLKQTDCHPLIASCIFHYEFEFIHPFSDGNGRMGRLWQTLYLSHWQPMFAYLPVETVIKDQQNEYYQALSASDKASDSTAFILFMLKALHSAVNEVITEQSDQVTVQVSDQVKSLLIWLNNKDPQKLAIIMEGLALKHRPTFKKNYITPALEENLIAMTEPDSPRSPQQKYYVTKVGEQLVSR